MALDLIAVFANQFVIFLIISSIALYGKDKARLRSQSFAVSDFDFLIDCTEVGKDLYYANRKP